MADRPAKVRIVMVCDHPECKPPYRAFLESEEQAAKWECPLHHRGVRQENRPYFGQRT